MTVNWTRNTQNNEWFDFLKLNLDSPYFSNKKGVYVIWYTSPLAAKVVRLGSGNIAERLKEHRSNQDILKYSGLGQMKVSWIIADNNPVKDSDLLGIEAFLANHYSPLIGDRYPDVTPIQVNLIGR